MKSLSTLKSLLFAFEANFDSNKFQINASLYVIPQHYNSNFYFLPFSVPVVCFVCVFENT